MIGRSGGGAGTRDAGAGRAGVFDDNLADFQPAPTRATQVRDIAEQAGFRSRDTAAPLPVAPPVPEQREVRRYRTGRNRQLNLKVRAEDAEAFYAIADAQGWVLGETFTHAIAALQQQISKDSS